MWGWTFVVVKEGIRHVPPLSFNAVRFGLAAAAVAPWCLPGLRNLGRDGWRHGALLGAFLFGGYTLQTVGLALTKASTAGFITGLFVVFTPLLGALVLRQAPGGSAVAATVLATVGLGLISLEGALRPSLGDVLVLGCALSFAAHIVGLGAWSQRHAALPLTVAQLAVVALLSALGALMLDVDRAAYSWDRNVLVAIVVTALLASAAAFWVQTAAQRVIPPTRTAVILTMEPVFAGLFGFVLLGERLPLRGWVGGGLIVAAMLAAELGGREADVVAAPEAGPALTDPDLARTPPPR